MINIFLNDLSYQYDVYQIVSLFYNLTAIKFSSENYDYAFEINKDNIKCIHDNYSEVFNISRNEDTREEIKKTVFKFIQNITSKELPWGTLVGIRPSKIALRLMNEGKNNEYIINYFKEHYLTDKVKAKLCIDVALYEKNIVNDDSKKVSIYIGMPFCPTRCLYCSFASNPISSCRNLVMPYLDALNLEIKEISDYVKEKKLIVESIYFGGGTPTSVDDIQFETVIRHLYESFIVNSSIREFTVECGRPDSLTLEKFKTMKRYNVNRISINPQTMNDKTLKAIGRKHNSEDIIKKYYTAREIGFECINMDIIVGLMGEGLDEVKYTCDKIYELKPDNLTVHGLSVKRGSALHENIVNNYEFKLPEQNVLNQMFDTTMKLSEKLNMKPYYMYRQKNMVGNMENVGYSVQGKEGIYNIQMIEEKQTIIAAGADAVTKTVSLPENRIERFGNVKDVREYNKRIDEMIIKKKKLLDGLYS